MPKEKGRPRYSWAVAIAFAAAFLWPDAASAQGNPRYYGPWCAAIHQQFEDCAYASVRQCRASVHGLGGYCFRNPRAAFYRVASVPQRKKRRARR